jgi:phosphatidyl-myo-inositol dimannoside synthase
VSHLLVTNDFPPKVGGIQTYLWELWRRLPPAEVAVLTTAYPGAADWDRDQAFPVERTPGRVLVPGPGLVRRVGGAAAAAGAQLVVIDPALPVALIGPALDTPYAVVVHGAEITVPGRLPGTGQALGRLLGRATGIVAAGPYPAAEALRAAGRLGRQPDVVEIPPGVDQCRFHPLADADRAAARRRLGLPVTGPLVVCASRLVPRKGVDVIIEAMTRLIAHRPDLTLAVAGAGRDAGRLRTLAGRLGIKVRFLGRVPDADLPDLFACADVFAMVCRNRWGGLEQEGFGIVFLEAAAAGVPQVAGESGGAAEAVIHGETGLVVARPDDPGCVAQALRELLSDPALAKRMGAAGRVRVVASFDYDALASRLADTLEEVAG